MKLCTAIQKPSTNEPSKQRANTIQTNHNHKMKTYNHTMNGKVIATYNQNEKPKYKTLKQVIQNKKRQTRDTIMLAALTK